MLKNESKNGQKNCDSLFDRRNYCHCYEKRKMKTLFNFMFSKGKLFRSARGLVEVFKSGGLCIKAGLHTVHHCST